MKLRKTVVLVEKSLIIRKGLLVLLAKNPYVGELVELDEEDLLKNRLLNYRPDMLIINASILGTLFKQDIRETLQLKPSTKIVSLVYSYIDEQSLHAYDANLYINYTKEKIEETLNQLFLEEKESIEEVRELSNREKEVLVEVVKGKLNKEIADYLNISINTVITHRRNIAKKTDIHSSAGLTVFAILNKLIDIEDLKK